MLFGSLDCILGLLQGMNEGELPHAIHVIGGDVFDFGIPIALSPTLANLAVRDQLGVHVPHGTSAKLIILLAGARGTSNLAQLALHFDLRTFLFGGHFFRPFGTQLT